MKLVYGVCVLLCPPLPLDLAVAPAPGEGLAKVWLSMLPGRGSLVLPHNFMFAVRTWLAVQLSCTVPVKVVARAFCSRISTLDGCRVFDPKRSASEATTRSKSLIMPNAQRSIKAQAPTNPPNQSC